MGSEMYLRERPRTGQVPGAGTEAGLSARQHDFEARHPPGFEVVLAGAPAFYTTYAAHALTCVVFVALLVYLIDTSQIVIRPFSHWLNSAA